MKYWFALSLVVGLVSQYCWAEDDLWSKPTYEKKLFNVGQKLLEASKIDENIVFLVSYRTQKEKNNVNATGDDAHAVVTVENGLLKYIESDDELAFVLGHEIAHVIQRHGSKRRAGSVARGVLITTPLTVAGAVGGVPGMVLANRLGHGLNKAITNSGNRTQESEADRIGLALMKAAGYDTSQAIRMAKKIFSDGSAFKIWRTHPMGKERLAQLNQLIDADKKLPDSQTPVSPTIVNKPDAEPAVNVQAVEESPTVEGKDTEDNKMNEANLPSTDSNTDE